MCFSMLSARLICLEEKTPPQVPHVDSGTADASQNLQKASALRSGKRQHWRHLSLVGGLSAANQLQQVTSTSCLNTSRLELLYDQQLYVHICMRVAESQAVASACTIEALCRGEAGEA